MNTTNEFEDKFPNLNLNGLDKEGIYLNYLKENSKTHKSFFTINNEQLKNDPRKSHEIKIIRHTLPANLPALTDPAPTTKINFQAINPTPGLKNHNKIELLGTAYVVGTIKALRFNYEMLKSVCESIPDFGQIISDSIQQGLSKKTSENLKEVFDTIGKKIQYSFMKNYKSQIKFVIKTGLHLLNIENQFDAMYDNQLPHINLNEPAIFQQIEDNNKRYNQ